MIYGYARVSTDGQSLDAQVRQLRAAGAEKVFRETATGVFLPLDQGMRELIAAPLEARATLEAAKVGETVVVIDLDPPRVKI